MGRPFYSRRHYDRLSNGGPDAPGAAEERIRLRRVGERAHADMLARFGSITPENARDALAFQEERIRFYQTGG